MAGNTVTNQGHGYRVSDARADDCRINGWIIRGYKAEKLGHVYNPKILLTWLALLYTVDSCYYYDIAGI